MELDDFIQTYKEMSDLSEIRWEHFPMKLQEAGSRFMNNWTDELPIRHLRELSGFDDMNVEDLLQYANKLPEEEL